MSNPIGDRSNTPLPAREGPGRVLRWEYSLRKAGFSLSLGVVVLTPGPEDASDLQVLEPAADRRLPNETPPRALGPGEPERGQQG